MTGGQYRSVDGAIRERLAEHLSEIDRLRAISPLRRAILPPGTVHELDAFASRIDAALGRGPGLDVLTELDEVVPRIEAVLSRADEEAARMRARSREVPLPPAPKPFPFGQISTLSVERPFRDQLRDAKEVTEYGVGMLARLEHAGTELVLVARGRARGTLLPSERNICCLLRASLPRGPAINVEHRSLFRCIVPSRDAVAIEPGFDGRFQVKGNASVARALLDAKARECLLAMRYDFRMLTVGDGLIDLAWWRPFPYTAFLPDAALSIVTSIANRLYAA